MEDKQVKTEYSVEAVDSFYQTGSTQPPKSRVGVILVLLGLVIFLGGIVAALGLTNLQLFRALQAQEAQETNAVGFSAEDSHSCPETARQTGLGFRGETVSDFWHTYHDLPRGVFVQSVDEGSDAALQGVLPGDILTRVNGTPVTAIEQLPDLLAESTGERVEIVLHRAQGNITLRIHPYLPEERE